MIKTWAYDVEVLRNFFCITVVSLNDYLDKFKDIVDEKGKAVPLTKKLKVSEIKERLATVENKSFYITDTYDKELFTMVGFIKDMKPFNNVYNHWFGFNSSKYDSLIIAALLMYLNTAKTAKKLIQMLYDVSQRIISLQDDKEAFNTDYQMRIMKRYGLPYKDIDVMNLFGLNKVGVAFDKDGNKSNYGKSLKQTSINLQWYELLEYEMPPITEDEAVLYPACKNMSLNELNKNVSKWQRYIKDEYIPEMKRYNLNDTFIVCEMCRLYADEIRLRYSISKSYGVDVLSGSRSNISDTLFEKFYSDFSGLVPSQWKNRKTYRPVIKFSKVIFNKVRFKTSPLKGLLDKMMKISVTKTTKDAFSENIKIGDLTYTLAMGGLHSQDLPQILKSRLQYRDPNASFTGKIDESFFDSLADDSYVIVHQDVTSYYPSLMSVYNISPGHLVENIFVKLVTWLKDTRVTAKHSKEEFIDGIPRDVLAQALKIVINSLYGKTNFKFGSLYDPLATMKVTINGQLFLLMLCEELEMNGIKVMSANTDGIILKVYARQYRDMTRICKSWEEYTGMQLDAEYYDIYVARDINNFCLRDFKGKISYKGDLNPKMYAADLSKGYNAPVVAEAVVRYFMENKPIMDTLEECTDILDFCKTQNIGRKYTVELGTSPVQRNVRFYVSIRGDYLFKIDTAGKRYNLCSGYMVTVLNSLDDVPIENRNINYQYYYDEAMKIIDPIMLGISPNQKSDLRARIRSGRSKIRKYSGDYGKLFENEEK